MTPAPQPIKLRSGRFIARAATCRSGCKKRFTVMSPVRLELRLQDGAVRAQRLSGSDRRRFRIGSHAVMLGSNKHDSVTEQTIAVAHKQQLVHESADSGASCAIDMNRLRHVLKKQSAKGRRFTSWKTLKRLLHKVLHHMVAGRSGNHLWTSIQQVHRLQYDYTTYDDGKTPCRPLGLKTLDDYSKAMWGHLITTDPNHTDWTTVGAQWIASLTLPPCYFEFEDEFFEYA